MEQMLCMQTVCGHTPRHNNSWTINKSCEICSEEFTAEYSQSRYCDTCRDDFKTSDSDK